MEESTCGKEFPCKREEVMRCGGVGIGYHKEASRRGELMLTLRSNLGLLS